jgi:hypothetical protein
MLFAFTRIFLGNAIGGQVEGVKFEMENDAVVDSARRCLAALFFSEKGGGQTTIHQKYEKASEQSIFTIFLSSRLSIHLFIQSC